MRRLTICRLTICRLTICRLTICLLTVSTLTACGGLISNQREVEIGQSVDGELRKQYRLVDSSDPVAVWAREFVGPLEAASKPFRDPSEIGGYKVAIISDDALVNAFAAPGGYTYISTGLILQSASCAEIAGVMGHELAHVTQKHGVKALEQAMAAQALGDMIFGEGTISSQAAQTIVSVLQSTKFSREHEAESDGVGLQISASAGYNPFGLSQFFQKLLKAGGSGGVPEFLSSHPATDQRIKDVDRAIKKRYGDRYKKAAALTQGCQKTRLQLDEVKSRIKGKRLELRPQAERQSKQ